MVTLPKLRGERNNANHDAANEIFKHFSVPRALSFPSMKLSKKYFGNNMGSVIYKHTKRSVYSNAILLNTV